MNNYDKVINGVNLYPVIGKKYINIVFESDSFTKFIVMEVLYEYYGFKKLRVITDSTYEKWYFVDYIENRFNSYTIDFVAKIGCMNKYSMMDDYIDLFNNRIEYKTI